MAVVGANRYKVGPFLQKEKKIRLCNKLKIP